MSRLACIVFILSAVVVAQNAKLTHVPLEAYAGEVVTFSLTGREGDKVLAELNGKELKTATFAQNAIELNLSFKKSGPLRISCGAAEWTFLLIRPEDDVKLALKDGYLYAGEQPAILLVEHRHPKKHSRKWEVAKLARSLFRDVRQPVSSALLVTPEAVPARRLSELSATVGTTAKFWRLPALPEALYEVDRLLVGDLSQHKADAIVIALTGNDLKRGMLPLRFRLRIEWLLQRLNRTGPVYIVSLPFTHIESKKYPSLGAELNVAARANGARYLKVGGQRGLISRLPVVVTLMRRDLRF